MRYKWGTYIHLQPAWRAHDDVIKWKHFRVTGPLCGNSPVNSPHKGQWRGALMFYLIRTWINAWVNNREAGDLIRHRAHYDVILMRPVSAYQKILKLCCVTDEKLITMAWCGSKRESINGGNYPYDLIYNIYFSSSLFSPLCAAINMSVSQLNMFYAHDMTWYPEIVAGICSRSSTSLITIRPRSLKLSPRLFVQ